MSLSLFFIVHLCLFDGNCVGMIGMHINSSNSIPFNRLVHRQDASYLIKRWSFASMMSKSNVSLSSHNKKITPLSSSLIPF
ncbi:hypothetical protein BC941DRAFT_200600 [Chlamydoabsidia padenii]|nr:hypothetical protein BC941DRAFT_200600 [Chlamydoabsidia padenii]